MVDLAWLQAQFADIANLASLNKGGQKLVFSGAHAGDGAVVLKLILPGQDIERTRREILAVTRIGSARVPKILAEGTVTIPTGENVVWLREQRIDGHSLREVLKQRTLDRGELCRLGVQILEALAAGERVRIVHRDVKPENIMVDVAGNFWLLDFGIARHLDLVSRTATAAGGIGTAGYAPPEQYRNLKKEIDGRCDLFALGVTMAECATGVHPFLTGARSFRDVAMKIETKPLPPLTIPGDVGEELKDFIHTLMQRRPDHRPATAAEALQWITEICRGRV